MFRFLFAATPKVVKKWGAAFIICCLPTVVLAAAPAVGTISPSSGSTAPNASITFTCTYTDADGWANLKEAYFLVSASSTSLASAVYVYYDQDANLLYVRNDANTAWLGGFTPGSTNVIQNSQASLNCRYTTATGSSSTLTVKWSLSFKAAYTGKKYNTYLYVKDDTGGVAGWTQKGTYAVNRSPVNGTVMPSSGTASTNVPYTFTTTYTDGDGWQNIQYVELELGSPFLFLISTLFKVNYNQNENKLYLSNDGTSGLLGGFSPGSTNVIENTYAKLNCAATTVSNTATGLTVSWSITFKQEFAQKNIYLYVKDDAGYSDGRDKVGTWTVQSFPPQVVTLTPSSGGSIPNTEFTFTSSFSDANAWQDIKDVNFIINTSATGGSGFYGYYNAVENKLYLRNDADTAWVGGFAPGASSIIENSFVRLHCAGTAVSGAGNTLNISWVLSFRPSFTGTKSIFLSVKDRSGLGSGWQQKGTWQPLDSGQILGPAGGVVYSQDGSIKVTVPSGALSAPTAIKLTKLSNEAMAGATPSQKALLGAVDCQPYGLVFNAPAALTYTFPQAEIPGTPLELGLYDSVQQTIVPTGQVAAVPADGYSATFSLLHFSTYAALKSLTSQATPVGAGVKIPLPDMFTGAFGHAIPITVPPGRKGMQPALAISYRSSNPNSWVGMSYSLNPGYIVRSTRLGPPSYNDSQDTFYLITDAGTTELVNLIDNLYQSKIESGFAKFYKEPDDSWRVIGKDGSTLRFGSSLDAREGSVKGTFSWYLTRATDNNGNYVVFSYMKDEGKCYLSRIDYTGNEIGVTPTHSVEFLLEPRSDIASSYVSTSRIATARRLREILVKIGTDVVWRYELTYAYSADTNRSLLAAFTQYASDGKSAPVQTFVYQESR